MTTDQPTDFGRYRQQKLATTEDIEDNAILAFMGWLAEQRGWPHWSDPKFDAEAYLEYYNRQTGRDDGGL